MGRQGLGNTHPRDCYLVNASLVKVLGLIIPQIGVTRAKHCLASIMDINKKEQAECLPGIGHI